MGFFVKGEKFGGEVKGINVGGSVDGNSPCVELNVVGGGVGGKVDKSKRKLKLELGIEVEAEEVICSVSHVIAFAL